MDPLRRPLVLVLCVAGSLAIALPAGRASAAGAVTLPNGSHVYSSGIDLSSGVDQRYAMTLNPYDPGSPTANLNSVGYLSANNANSAWIGPAFPNVHTPESVYRVRTLVNLTGVDLAGFSLTGYWVSDNQGLDILVNGNSTGFTNNGAHGSLPTAFPENFFALDASSGLVAGPNVIEFEWGNGPAGGAGSQFPNPTHVRVEFIEVVDTVPTLPPLGAAALALLLALAAGTVLRARGARTRVSE